MTVNSQKTIIRIILVCIVVSALSHWKDIKHGVVDSLNDGAEIITSK